MMKMICSKKYTMHLQLLKPMEMVMEKIVFAGELLAGLKSYLKFTALVNPYSGNPREIFGTISQPGNNTFLHHCIIYKLWDP